MSLSPLGCPWLLSVSVRLEARAVVNSCAVRLAWPEGKEPPRHQVQSSNAFARHPGNGQNWVRSLAGTADQPNWCGFHGLRTEGRKYVRHETDEELYDLAAPYAQARRLSADPRVTVASCFT